MDPACEPSSLPFAFLLSIENMGSTLYLFMLMPFLLLMVTNAFSAMQHPQCHGSESSALLQFKQSFLIDEDASDDPSAYPKVERWQPQGEESDCCSWDGVECDMDTGHVIGLHLASSCLYGSLNSSSTLFHLVHLRRLDLSDNDFNHSEIPHAIGKLLRLSFLNISGSHLNGEIPPFLANLTRLNYLNLEDNQLTGKIPSCLGNLTRLTCLALGYNNLLGLIPNSVFGLTNLETLYLRENNLSGIIELNMLFTLKNLTQLGLSFNSLSLLTNTNVNATVPKFKVLGLGSCNLTEFPNFLRNQDQLELLILNSNKIQGQIPKWIGNTGKETLSIIDLSYNFLTGFAQPLAVLSWVSLRYLDLRSNMLQGSLPIPPSSIFYYFVQNNKLTGEVPKSICNLTSLGILDLSSNNFSGMVPQCLSNPGNSLSALSLRGNNFHGMIPHTCIDGNRLTVLDASQNQFEGRIPRSLAKCKLLQILNLGHNQINDTFPFWLGALPELEVLILRSNRFHGAVGGTKTNFQFSKLHILDLSDNGFTGNLPSEYFQNWDAMKVLDTHKLSYMQAVVAVKTPRLTLQTFYFLSMIIVSKGLTREYEKIPDILTAIDLSSNKFDGLIPESFGIFKGLQLLNLSNNAFTGPIPTSFTNMTILEALDISQNNLSGEIPQQLVQLTFLEFFSVSHNHLMGSIPQGQQFGTFPNSSFDGNPRLCGSPLSRACGSSEAPPLAPSTSEQGSPSTQFDWKIVLMGYGSGLVIGVSIGYCLNVWKHEWFVKTFGRQQRKTKKERTEGEIEI